MRETSNGNCEPDCTSGEKSRGLLELVTVNRDQKSCFGEKSCDFPENRLIKLN